MFLFVTHYNLWKSISDRPSVTMVPAAEDGGGSIPKDFTCIPIRRIENLNTFTFEEVYETLQNCEFEAKGLQETPVSKPVGAALIAPRWRLRQNM
ncbi:hypothetical protein L1987_15347 [Smallanthus sonchifolius]|uniref:Uncharacterized protein n=1 Tax=Smallanthus sonchifolius TaxID=185202 RepID=A0ACB9J6V5_9ASTR|nr:hypothetical protein L1987_15347 [Smallanthus sonchifolius]